MNPPDNNPPEDSVPQTPGNALRTARIVIALGLVAGVGVFGVFAINRLMNPPKQQARASGFGASDQALFSPDLNDPQSLADLARTNPRQYIPIIRDNPHPGKIAPYLDAASFGQPPYRQPNEYGEVWEFAAYRSTGGNVKDAIAHYNKKAEALELTLLREQPTGGEIPNGLRSAWTDGTNRLEVTAWPHPVTPPMRPMLNWVVKYSYPDPNRDD